MCSSCATPNFAARPNCRSSPTSGWSPVEVPPVLWPGGPCSPPARPLIWASLHTRPPLGQPAPSRRPLPILRPPVRKALRPDARPFKAFRLAARPPGLYAPSTTRSPANRSTALRGPLARLIGRPLCAVNRLPALPQAARASRPPGLPPAGRSPLATAQVAPPEPARNSAAALPPPVLRPLERQPLLCACRKPSDYNELKSTTP